MNLKNTINLYLDKTKFIYINDNQNTLNILKNKNTLIKFNLKNSELFYKEGSRYLYLISIINNKIIIRKIYFNCKRKIEIYNLPKNNYKNLTIDNIYITEENELIIYVYPLKKYFIIKNGTIIIKNKLFNNLESNKEYDFQHIDLKNNLYTFTNKNKKICSNIIRGEFSSIKVYSNIFLTLNDFVDNFEIKIFHNGINKYKNIVNGKIYNILQDKEIVYFGYIFENKYNCSSINLKNYAIQNIIINSYSKIDLVNSISKNLLIEKDSILKGCSLINLKTKQKLIIYNNKYKYEPFIENIFTPDLKYTKITNCNQNESLLLISFHGGPESVELLSNNYERLYYKLLIKYKIKIIIFNYPGSVSYNKFYRTIPHNNWSKIINTSFNNIIKKEYNNVSKIILIGGSFGGTLQLLINNCIIKNKIIINPLFDLKNHIENIPFKYKKWFKNRFSKTDEKDININTLLNNNKNKNIFFILGSNDEIINKNDIYEYQKRYTEFKYLWDDGTHTSNYINRSVKILEIIKEIYEQNYWNK